MIDEIEDMLRECEAKLEEVGQKVCPLKGGAETWMKINEAVDSVQEALHYTFKIEEE